MKILISTQSMHYLSGAALYNYELARELRLRGHDVQAVSTFTPIIGNAGGELRKRLEAIGVDCLDRGDGTISGNIETPEVIFASEHISTDVISLHPEAKVINVIHSEYEYEAPITLGVDHYVAIRGSIKDKLVKDDGIAEEKIAIIGNGIDATRFNPQVRAKRLNGARPYKVTLVPCTIDHLRTDFLTMITATASPEHHVIVMGVDFGAIMPRNNPNVTILPDHFDMENYIGQADVVAGILLGRVNLEAMMMNVKSDIYDPKTMAVTPFLAGYRSEYDIKNVTTRLLELV